MKINYLFYILLLIGFMSSCSTTENPTPAEDELKAIIKDQDQTVAPFTEVTLDGSQSTGPDGIAYEWIYNGNENIVLSSTSEAIVTFTPEKNTFYDFILRVTFNGQFSETNARVTVTGAIVLDANSFNSSDQLILKDIENDPSKPDYLINTDFTIPVGKTMLVDNGQNVTIGIDDGAGIIVEGRLTFGGSSSITMQKNSTSWKGILVDGGSFDNYATTTYIKNAGGVAFIDQTPAAITVTNGGSTEFTGSTFIEENIADHGIVITESASFNQDFGYLETGNVKYPIKTDMAHFRNSMFTGFNSSGYEYIHLTTSGAGTTVGAYDGQFTFNNKTFFIDGDFTAGAPIVMNAATVYMKEGAGIVGGDIQISSTTIQGLSDLTWKGIASTGNVFVTNNSSVIGAGSAVHNTGSFTTTEKAAVYSSMLLQVKNSTIANSGGYGAYMANQNPNGEVSTATFTNNVLNDVILPYSIVAQVIGAGNTWSSTTPVALTSGDQSSSGAWPSLGAGNAYLATTNIVVAAGILTLNPGVEINFKAGKNLTVTSKLVAKGTANEPIIFNGEDDTPGSWAGILLQGQYQMEYCTITNGGGSTFIGAQAAVNIAFGSNSSIAAYPQTLYSFENNTVSNSADFGATILLGKYDPVTPTATNTYTGNANGTIKLP